MTFGFQLPLAVSTALVAAILTFTGCSENSPATADATPVADEHADHAHEHGDHDEHGDHASHQHGEWWCGEHGVPEEECARCDKSLVAKFKEAGDWCDEHNRPDSQCFVCNPDNFEKYAALYEAKYGERPERPAE